LKIAIIGGGASGIIAAITAKRLNKNIEIDIFDANKSIGKKYWLQEMEDAIFQIQQYLQKTI
jgi:predicted flavoprotein YhiN